MTELLTTPIIEYKAFNNIKYQLCPCVGKNIALLVPPSIYEKSILNTIVAKIDLAYDFYFITTGKTPTLYYKYLTYATIAVVNSTCGAGCGFLGATGIEIITEYFNTLYNNVKNNNLYDQIVFYELGRNFWFYRKYIEYVDADEIANITTGYAIFMRFASMEYAGINGSNFGNLSFNTFKQSVIDNFLIYLNDNSLSWFNTFKIGKSATGGNSTTLVASMFFKLNELFGEPFTQTTENSFISKLWRAVSNTPIRLNTQDAIDNLVTATSIASGVDAKPLFKSWKFPLKDEPIVQIKPLIIPALQEWTSNDKIFRLTTTTNIYISTEDLRDNINVFVDDLLGITNIKNNFEIFIYDETKIKNGDIIFILDNNFVIQNEGYKLEINDIITITSNNKEGLFWSSRTLLQLLKQNLNILGGLAIDYPQYPERSFMIDNGRKYFTPQWLMNKIKELSYFKYNYFHWHMSDTQGFRIESNNINHNYLVLKKSEVTEIINLAQKYFINIIPEFEMPAHMGIWVPEKYRLIDNTGKIFLTLLNIANDDSIKFVQDLIEEFIPLFPCKYIHIGGDEFGVDWDKLDNMLPYIKQKLNNPNAVVEDTFIYFINTMNNFIKTFGKTTRIWASNIQGSKNLIFDKDIIMEVWDLGVNPNTAVNLNYNIMNCSFYPTYFVQGWEPKRPHYADFAIYEQWNPTLFYTQVYGETPKQIKPLYTISLPQPLLLGGKMHIWSDNPNIQTEEMVNKNTFNNLRNCSQVIWGSPKLVSSFSDFLPIILKIGEQPNIIPNPLTPRDVSGVLINPNIVIFPNEYANLIADTKFGWKTNNTKINVVLNNFTLTLDNGGGNPYNYSGVISGNGNLNLISANSQKIIISGSNPNLYNGLTTLSKGVVILSKPNNVISITKDLIINNSGDDGIIWKNSFQFSTDSNVTVNSIKGILDLDVYQEKINILKMSNGSKLNINNGGVLTVNKFFYADSGFIAGTYTSLTNPFITGSGQLIVLTNSSPTVIMPFNVSGVIDNPNSIIDFTHYYANLTANTTFGKNTSSCAINVSLNNFNFTLDNNNVNTINYSGIISGSGSVFINGSNTNTSQKPLSIILSGSKSNNFRGTLTLLKGVLELNKINSTSITGNLIVNNFSKEQIIWSQPYQFTPNSNITVNCVSGVLNIGNFSERINNLVLTNGSSIISSSNSVFTVNRFYYNNIGYANGTYTKSTLNPFIVGDGKLVVLINSATNPPNPPNPSSDFPPLIPQNINGIINNPNSIINNTKNYAFLTANTTFGWQTNKTSINVFLNKFNLTLNNGNGNNFEYSGSIKGNGNIIIIGSNTNVPNPKPVILSGSLSNNYIGTFILTKGVLQLSKNNAVCIAGDLTINNFSKETVLWNTSFQFSINSNINMNCVNGVLNIGNFQDKINNLNMVLGSTIITDNLGVLTVNQFIYNKIALPTGVYTSKNKNFIFGNGKIVVL